MIASHFRFLHKLSGTWKRQDRRAITPRRGRKLLLTSLVICCALLSACGKYPSRYVVAAPASPLSDPLATMRDIAVRSGAVHEGAIDPAVNRRVYFGKELGYVWAEAMYCTDPECGLLVTLLVGEGTGRLIFWIRQRRFTNDLRGEGLNLFERVTAEARRRFGPDLVYIIVN